MKNNSENKTFALQIDSIEKHIFDALHYFSSQFARKANTDPEINRLRKKPLIELYEEQQQLKLWLKIYRSNLSKRAWRRNRYRQPYKQRLIKIKKALEMNLGDAKLAGNINETIALQNYYLEHEPW